MNAGQLSRRGLLASLAGLVAAAPFARALAAPAVPPSLVSPLVVPRTGWVERAAGPQFYSITGRGRASVTSLDAWWDWLMSGEERHYRFALPEGSRGAWIEGRFSLERVDLGFLRSGENLEVRFVTDHPVLHFGEPGEHLPDREPVSVENWTSLTFCRERALFDLDPKLRT